MSENSNQDNVSSTVESANAVPLRQLTKKRRTSEIPKTGVALKRLWHSYRDESKHRISLKAFAKSISEKKGTSQLVQDWWDHKRGSLEIEAKASRKKNKGARIAQEALASKQARRKNKGPSKPAVV